LNTSKGDMGDATDKASKAGKQAASISEIIDLERSQIGHDIHDLLLPLIFAASANVQVLVDQFSQRQRSETSQLPPPDTKLLKRLQESQDWLQQALSVGRNLLTEIYPAELEQLTWLAAAKDTARRMSGEAAELIWIVDPSSPICDLKWDRDLATTAYRVLVESVRNALRHGQATKITVYCQPDQLMIIDDGIGFRPQDVPAGHFGIRSMKGRALLVDKTVTIESKPGGPTTVTLTL